MENLLLKMHYNGGCIKVKVDDTDRSLLIDIVNDMFDEAQKHQMQVPQNPSFSYKYNRKTVELRDDKGLLEMFSRFDGKKEIDIWIGVDDVPSPVVQLARELMGDNVNPKPVTQFIVNPAIYNGSKGRQKLPIKRKHQDTNPLIEANSNGPNPIEPNPIEPNPVDHNLVNPNPIEPNPVDPNHVDPNPVDPNPVDPKPIMSPRRSARLSQGSIDKQLNQPDSSPRIGTRTNPTPVTNVVTAKPKYKMAISTARMKGIELPKTLTKSVSGVDNSRRSTRGVRVEYNATDDDELSDESESDKSYNAEESENGAEEVSDEEVSDLEVEDNIVLSSLEMIDDGYVPFQSNVWCVEEEGYSAQLYNNGEMYDCSDFGHIQLRPWMLFMDKDHFKDVLRDYCIQEGFFLIVIRADHRRYTAECATLGCEWRIHASVLPDGTSWAIKTITNPEHGCEGVTTHNPMANAEWVAKQLMEDIRANPAITKESIQSLLMDRFGLQMKPSTLYKMKDLALKEINGGHDESYRLLPTYCEMVKATNKGSYAICAWNAMDTPERLPQFKSVFVSFKAQFEGLMAGCRSLIGVDGTHLKGNHGGVLLVAVALDGNNELFPVAISVVEAENKDSWSHFFWHLKHILKDSGRQNWTIISDRQKGIEPALDSIWPEAYRRYCARHLCKNFKGEYPGVLMHQLFWRVVNATSEFSFKKAMGLVVKKAGDGCARWFLDLGDKELWAKHMFNPEISSDENTSNFVESFNSTLGVSRSQPVLSLLEALRRQKWHGWFLNSRPSMGLLLKLDEEDILSMQMNKDEDGEQKKEVNE